MFPFEGSAGLCAHAISLAETLPGQWRMQMVTLQAMGRVEHSLAVAGDYQAGHFAHDSERNTPRVIMSDRAQPFSVSG